MSEPSPAGRDCPKCDTHMAPEAAACPSCGLAVEHMEAWAADSEPPRPELDDAWRACLSAWDDPAVHDRFCREAARTEDFAFAGRAYRRAARERGASDPQVVAGLERVKRMAEAAWMTRPPGTADADAGPTPYRGATALLLALMILAALGGLGFLIMRAVRGHPDAARPPAVLPRRRAPAGRAPGPVTLPRGRSRSPVTRVKN